LDELNINSILKGDNNFPVKIGELKSEVINILNLNLKPKDIKMYPDRIYHCEYHKKDFESENSYQKSLKSIPLIINSPDYIGLSSENNSISYVKKIAEDTLVAVRVVEKGSLQFRTMFPINEHKLNYYLKNGKLQTYTERR